MQCSPGCHSISSRVFLLNGVFLESPHTRNWSGIHNTAQWARRYLIFSAINLFSVLHSTMSQVALCKVEEKLNKVKRSPTRLMNYPAHRDCTCDLNLNNVPMQSLSWTAVGTTWYVRWQRLWLQIRLPEFPHTNTTAPETLALIICKLTSQVAEE